LDYEALNQPDKSKIYANL